MKRKSIFLSIIIILILGGNLFASTEILQDEKGNVEVDENANLILAQANMESEEKISIDESEDDEVVEIHTKYKASNISDVQIGDYVNYPVDYSNVNSFGGSSNKGNLTGWRVLSIDGNTVTLVSAGVPLAYNYVGNLSTGIYDLAVNFLNVSYQANGIGTLNDAFNNEFTAIYETNESVTYDSSVTGEKVQGDLKVRSMTLDDLKSITGGVVTGLTNSEYDYLLAVPTGGTGYTSYAAYWLASKYNSMLGCVGINGAINQSGGYNLGVRPVVTLKSNVNFTGKDSNGAWNISIGDEEKTAYAVYSETDNSLRFYKTTDTITQGSTYNGLAVTNVYTDIETDTYTGDTSVPWYSVRSNIKSVVVENEIAPVSTYLWFYELKNTTTIDVRKLNTSNLKNMSFMFCRAGENVTNFTITGLNDWDTSTVEDMSQMFEGAGYSATTWSIGDLSSWNTSSVTNMECMFKQAGYSATTFSLDLSGWDTGAVTDMESMFNEAGYKATTFSLDLSGWDTSDVTDMVFMFYCVGYNAKDWSIRGLSDWDTGAVTNMLFMFGHAGHSAETFYLDLSGWDTGEVKNMSYMFVRVGFSAKTWSIGDLGGWDTGAVTDMSYMFTNAGYNSENSISLNLSGFDTSNVTNMTDMFNGMRKLTQITLGPNFSFNGNGSTSCTLPTPSASDISGADGKWYDVETGIGYAPSEIQNNKAKMYIARAIVTSTFDTIPPKGEITVASSEYSNNIYYVGDTKAILQISASDNVSIEGQIKVYISTTEINKTSMIDDDSWEEYYTGMTKEIILTDLRGITTVYTIFKDAAGNISTSFTGINCQYSVSFNYNGGDGSIPIQKAYYGESLVLTNQKPTRNGKYFLGWSKDASATTAEFLPGGIMQADNFTGSVTTIVLYAIWSDYPLLSNVVSIGDYVEYPVFYDDLGSNNQTGWKVISKNVDINGNADLGTVNIRSEGIPLIVNSSATVNDITEKFLESTLIAGGTKYTSSGLVSKITLTEIFSNKYTALKADGMTPLVKGEREGNNVYIVVSLRDTVQTTGKKQNDVWSVMKDVENITVTFNPNGGNVSQTSKTVKYGNIFGTLPTPTKVGFDFKGWYTSATGGRLIQSITKVMITENITLYAQWKDARIYSIANEPVLGEGMKAVYWTGENGTIETRTTSYTADMYNYDLADYGEDSKNSKWANAITTADGSYWVWIPRYAYKITYYTDSTKETVSESMTTYGDIDILFLRGTSNTEYLDKNGVVQRIPDGYIVHPAFQEMTTASDLSTNPLGKWNAELTGIWVAKYEASKDATTGKVVSKPSAVSWRDITVSDMYTNSQNMHSNLNSHQMKNSEWGAVAYLAYSSYGRNGNEIGVNQASNFYTGAGPGGTADVYNSNTYTFNSSNYGWNTTQGKKASTTGNIYGVYDMAGGAWEITASYVNNGNSNISNYGSAIKNSTDLRTRQIYYASATDGTSDTREGNKNANSSVYGDGIYETARWNSDFTSYPATDAPFFTRGGSIDFTENAGQFALVYTSGANDGVSGFRPVLALRDVEEANITFDLNLGLPTGYTALEYIEGTGTQYIDTGYSASNGYYAKIDMEFTELLGGDAILSSHNAAAPYGRNYVMLSASADGWELGVGDSCPIKTTTITTNTRYYLDYSTVKGNSYLYVNGVNMLTSTDSSNRSTNNLLLFTSQWELNVGRVSKMKVYSVQIYNSSNTLVRDFIPCINSSGVIGMYDLVESKFYTNKGTGTFKTGEYRRTMEVGTKIGELSTPTRIGYEFIGWYTAKEGGTRITTTTTVTNDMNNKVFYAQWNKSLSSVVSVGEYVNYPVSYTNVATSGTTNVGLLTGWRVLSVDGNKVRLVSAGVPLRYLHGSNADTSVTALTTNFKSTSYTLSGFSENLTLTFNNGYTESVSAMTLEDFKLIAGNNITTEIVKGNDMLGVPAINGEGGYAAYWLATKYDSSTLWDVGRGAVVEGGSTNYERGVRVVVTLNSDVMITGKDASGAWNISIPDYAGDMSFGMEGDIDCTGIVNYKDLTEDNIYVDIKNIAIPDWSNGVINITKQYNSSTGELKIVRNAIDGQGEISFLGNIYIAPNATYLGNYECDYEINIDCTSVVGWQNKTVNDFMMDLKWVNIPDDCLGTMTFDKTYNSTTGILNIKRNAIQGNCLITFAVDVFVK